MIMIRLRSIALALALVATSPAAAVQPDEILSDPALEARARALSRELRCMVCQNQSIDDSDAPLARDLRILVRERLTAGDSDAKVIEFLTARYGEFVLLKPRLTAGTALLWFAPVIALVAGGCGLWIALRRRRSRDSVDLSPSELSPAEQQRVAQLIGDDAKTDRAGGR
jgi:cytochrome c-type biogenesis protein CcmH